MTRTRPAVEEAILGFDAREMFIGPDKIWGDARRQAYLLRGDVRKVLSVDTAVWPSLFGEGLPEKERQRLGVDSVDLPDWTGPNQNLWDDLPRMRASLGQLAAEPHWIVAVTWVSVDGFSKGAATGGPYLERMTPSHKNDTWSLLGFDVADSGLISGLSDCIYSDVERSGLQAAWASHLNEHHLFFDVSRALMFSDVAERRVPEHAPFFVYALWVIDGAKP